MIAKQPGVCGFANWLGIAALVIAALIVGVCAPGADAEGLRMDVRAGYEQLAMGDAKQDQEQEKDKKDDDGNEPDPELLLLGGIV